jgi:hypothetical protein
MPDTLALNDIQKLQFHDRAAAEDAVLHLLRRQETMPIAHVELRVKPESLNSVNGYVTTSDGARFFFKAHTEENEQLDSYYNADLLLHAGYPVLKPQRVSSCPGQQFVLYELITLPTLFDITEQLDSDGPHTTDRTDAVCAAQSALDSTVFAVYEKSLRWASTDEHAAAPVRQLFDYRLQDSGRVGLFYNNKEVELGGTRVKFNSLAKQRWIVNGVSYPNCLDDIIRLSRELLKPAPGPVIIGHGDRHNGNVFYDRDAGRLFLFDPAFAGQHSPVLDLAKPIFHNVFARWMYFPDRVQADLRLEYEIFSDHVVVDHSFVPSSLRMEYLKSLQDNLLRPTMKLLSDQNMLSGDWLQQLRCALFCCAFLTVDLFAERLPKGTLAQTYSSEIKMLGLSLAVELGNPSYEGTNTLTQILDDFLCCNSQML